jgi:hypothetical protein
LTNALIHQTDSFLREDIMRTHFHYHMYICTTALTCTYHIIYSFFFMKNEHNQSQQSVSHSHHVTSTSKSKITNCLTQYVYCMYVHTQAHTHIGLDWLMIIYHLQVVNSFPWLVGRATSECTDMWHKPAISKHQHTLSASKGHSLFVNKALALAPAPALETLPHISFSLSL